jgi:ABC-type oligopeptide transport system ATPase subunit
MSDYILKYIHKKTGKIFLGRIFALGSEAEIFDPETNTKTRMSISHLRKDYRSAKENVRVSKMDLRVRNKIRTSPQKWKEYLDGVG